MVYFFTILCVVLCIITIILGLRLYRENRELEPWKSEVDDEDDELPGML